MRSILFLCTSAFLVIIFIGCSIDVFPVHHSKVNAAKRAEQPIARGPNAPGAFKKKLTFAAAQGYLFDPSKIELQQGILKLKSQTGSRGHMSTLQSSVGVPYLALDGFSETPSKLHQGQIKYQISHDGSKWFYYTDKQWTAASPVPSETNSAKELNEAIQVFDKQVGPGLLYVKIFLISPQGKEKAELQEIEIQGIAPRTDNWD